MTMTSLGTWSDLIFKAVSQTYVLLCQWCGLTQIVLVLLKKAKAMSNISNNMTTR